MRIASLEGVGNADAHARSQLGYGPGQSRNHS
jgi:hypothetical protein